MNIVLFEGRSVFDSSIPLLPFCEGSHNSAPFGDRPKSDASLCGTCIKAYFCLAEFNGNFVFKCSGSLAGFLLLKFFL